MSSLHFRGDIGSRLFIRPCWQSSAILIALVLTAAALVQPAFAGPEKAAQPRGGKAHAKSVKSRSATVKPLAAGKAEERLLQAIEMVGQQNLDGALKAVAALTSEVPNFRAAHLVYADLLRFKTGRMVSAPAPVGGMLVKHAPQPATSVLLSPEVQDQLQGLQDELRRRVQAAASLPVEGSIPAELLMLDASVRQAMAIDASKSRLYLFTNEGGSLRMTGNFYVSVGKLGMGKTEAGDQRTPQGVYFIGRQIPGAKLPEFYGKGALTMNYPNDWDRLAGRSGSGIWLHGTPPDQYARLPEASDGCVVLSNPDLTFLMRSIDLQTPVLVREQLQWLAPQDVAGRRKAEQSFLKVLDDWRMAWSRKDQRKLADLYAADFMKPEGSTSPVERLNAYFIGAADIALKDLSVYSWADAKGELRVVNLKASSKAFAKDLSLRQYWRKSGTHWKLFSEDVMGS